MGRLTLDRPAKLNALTLDMVRALTASLAAWEHDPDVRLVLLEGAGARGFCAGGDVRALYATQGKNADAHAFWAEEYRLNARIAAYPKPVVALMFGIVMGGGVGLGAHARFPIVTESTRLAMPEAAIGLIPDVGTMRLLSRAPAESGTYLALTSAQVGPADAIRMGFAKYFIAEATRERFAEKLVIESPADDEHVAAVIAEYAAAPGDALLASRDATAGRAFAFDTVEEIVRALHADGSDFALAAAHAIAARSPTSLKLSLRALREARGFDTIEASLRLEYRLMSRLITKHDFGEGVRATLVDKDRLPAWDPAELRAVTPAIVDAFFASLGADELRI